MTPEPLVSAENAAELLDISRRYFFALARKGIAGAHPLDGQAKRKVWRFRLSEVIGAMAKTAIGKKGKTARSCIRQSPLKGVSWPINEDV